ncbi:MAG: hypothetical protein MZV65_19255 [Chromatiales bacterium]|nr:hypothetical protein [Chromatiales bacterium]
MLLVALVPLGAIWYVDYRTANNYTTAAIQQQLAELSDRTVSQVNDWVTMNLKALNQNAGAGRHGVDGPEAPRTRSCVRCSTSIRWSYLVFTIGPDGMNIGRSDDKPPIDYADRIYFKQIMDGKPDGQPGGHQQDHQQAGADRVGADLLHRIHRPAAGGRRDRHGHVDRRAVRAHHQPAHRQDRLPSCSTKTARSSAPERGVRRHQRGLQPAPGVYRPAGQRPQGTGVRRRRPQGYRLRQATAQGWTMVTQQDYGEAYAPVRSCRAAQRDHPLGDRSCSRAGRVLLVAETAVRPDPQPHLASPTKSAAGGW